MAINTSYICTETKYYIHSLQFQTRPYQSWAKPKFIKLWRTTFLYLRQGPRTRRINDNQEGKTVPGGCLVHLGYMTKPIDTHTRTRTHARARTHTHTHFSLTGAEASLVVYQKSKSSVVGSFTDAAASALASPPAHDKAKGIVSASSHFLHLSHYRMKRLSFDVTVARCSFCWLWYSKGSVWRLEILSNGDLSWHLSQWLLKQYYRPNISKSTFWWESEA